MRGKVPQYEMGILDDQHVLFAQHFKPWYRAEPLLPKLWRNGKYETAKVDWLAHRIWNYMPLTDDDSGQKFPFDIGTWLNIRMSD